MVKRVVVAALLLAACAKKPLVVGSKNFTESVILGELVAQKLESAGCKVDRRLNLGGTLVCDAAITAGSLDSYVEYSGTALTAILKQPASNNRNAVTQEVASLYAARKLHWGPNLGFNNTFAMLVRAADAQRLGMHRISDLKGVESTFQPGFGYEFVERPDGWNGLVKTYGLAFVKPPRTMDLGLTYKALASGQVDLIAGDWTNGLIHALNLVALEDDRHYFPPYDAAIVSRNDIDQRCSGASAALQSLGGTIDDATMRRLNYEVDGKRRDVAEVVRELLSGRRAAAY
jgi:glycine betaine/choline ABC-type transport system substrate-binding protein